MKEKIVSLARHSAIYALGNALTVAGGFILIPLYTHVLTTSEYGVLELINRSADIVILVMFNGVRQGFIRYYFDHDNEDWHKTVVSSTLLILSISSIAVSLAVFLFREPLSALMLRSEAAAVLLVFVIVWLPLEMMARVGMTHLQIQKKSATYVLINLSRFFLLIGSNILLVYVYRKGIAGILITNMWIAGLVGLGFMAVLIRWTGIKLSAQVVKDLVKFGAPYAPTAVFMFLLSSSDRYFLSALVSLGAVGVYALAYKIGMFGTSLIMGPFGMIWTPFLFENYRKEDGPELIGKVFTLYTLAIVGVGLGVSVMSPIVIPLISDAAYHASYRLVPLICLAAIFYGMACIADAGILISKKTFYKPILFGAASIVSVGLNVALIPHYGAIGAAFTLSVSFFALFILVYWVSSRFYFFKIEYRKILSIFASAVFVYWLSHVLFAWSNGQPHLRMCSVLSLALFPALIWHGGVFSSEEKTTFKDFIGEKTAKLRGLRGAQETGVVSSK